MSDLASTSDAQDAKALAASKRKATDAGLPGTGARPHKSVKRRASKACQCCRARKVRCNVVEQTPCTNCRLDEVECIVSESKRKKKWTKSGDEEQFESQSVTARRESVSVPSPLNTNMVGQGALSFQDSPSHHVPHSLYQDLEPRSYHDGIRRQSQARSISIPHDPSEVPTIPLMDTATFLMPKPPSPVSLGYSLPTFIKPVPAKYSADDIAYLTKKGALAVPGPPLRNALLQCFIKFIHPYMPLLDLHELLEITEGNGEKSTMSLLLFQAIMFASTASVDIRLLKAAGYKTRRDARRDFFQKTRLLYDFDYETDRISLIQALLLMTYWYETPDDQKDSHHWMGIAVSLSHTIGLHRNPERSNMAPKRQRLWKRIWWATFMRDRLIALGMRRPTRIKNEDFDVPMLTIEDFDIAPLPAAASSAVNCKMLQDTTMQRELAVMCIEKAKLCICVSHVLATQYSVLHNNHGIQNNEGNTKSTMMLVARKEDPEGSDVRSCDERLRRWKAEVAPEAEYRPVNLEDMALDNEPVALSRSLLHMVYFATLSALHRPQVLPSTAWPARKADLEVLDKSRKTVRFAANKITAIAQNLSEMDFIRYLPTSGITVLLPAIIIHLLDIKAPDEVTRRESLQGFCQCMQILNKLRDIYAAADYSTAFLEAAIRKAEITLPKRGSETAKDNAHNTMMTQASKRTRMAPPIQSASRLTPPPDPSAHPSEANNGGPTMTDDAIAQRLNTFLASTPPNSEGQGESQADGQAPDSHLFEMPDFEPDFDALLNLDAAGEAFALDDGAFPMMQGEGAGFTLDMDWMKGMTEDVNVMLP